MTQQEQGARREESTVKETTTLDTEGAEVDAAHDALSGAPDQQRHVLRGGDV